MSDSPLTPDDISNILQGIDVVILFLGALGGIITFNIQKKHERDLQRSQFRREINLKTYQGLAEIIRRAQQATVKFQIAIHTIPANLKLHWDFKKSLPNATPPSERHDTFIQLQSNFSGAVVDTMNAIEENLIVFPVMQTSKAMLSVQHGVVGNRYQKFFMKLSNFLPTELPEKLAEEYPYGVFFRELDETGYKELRLLSDACWPEVSTVGAYLDDIIISLQNILLSDIYNGRILEYRVPLDKECLVLKTDKTTTEKLKIIINDHYQREMTGLKI